MHKLQVENKYSENKNILIAKLQTVIVKIIAIKNFINYSEGFTHYKFNKVCEVESNIEAPKY